MIIKTPDGKTRVYPFSSNACTGYRASSIEMEASDFRRMAEMQRRDPDLLQRCLLQLAGRFPAPPDFLQKGTQP